MTMIRIVKSSLALITFISLTACNRMDDGKIHLQIWHQKSGPERALFGEVIARFNAAHSDCVIEALYRENEELRNLYVIAAVAGQGPDIVYGPADNIGVF